MHWSRLLNELPRLPLFALRLVFLSRKAGLLRRHRYGRHWRQYLIEFLPSEKVVSRQMVVVFLHGGGWQFGRPEMFRRHAQVLTQWGYRVYMPSHRRLPGYDYEHLRSDMIGAMALIREQMVRDGIGHWPVVLGGSSSGGHLSALFALDTTQQQAAGFGDAPLRGLFLFGAPLHLGGMWNSPPLQWLAGPRDGALFRKANPYEYLNRPLHLPVLIAIGEYDGLVEPDSVAEFYRRLKPLNSAKTRYEVLPKGSHLDTASWCFADHPTHDLLLHWLREVEREPRAGAGDIAGA